MTSEAGSQRANASNIPLAEQLEPIYIHKCRSPDRVEYP